MKTPHLPLRLISIVSLSLPVGLIAQPSGPTAFVTTIGKDTLSPGLLSPRANPGSGSSAPRIRGE